MQKLVPLTFPGPLAWMMALLSFHRQCRANGRFLNGQDATYREFYSSVLGSQCVVSGKVATLKVLSNQEVWEWSFLSRFSVLKSLKSGPLEPLSIVRFCELYDS